MTTLPAVSSCGLYKPGHDVHWIQALRSAGAGVSPPTPGRIVEIADDGAVSVEIAGEPLVLWNHDPARLQAIIDHNGPEIGYEPRWSLLRSPGSRSAFCFSVVLASHSDRRPCPERPPTGTLVDLLRTAGGFSVRAGDLLR